MRSDTQPQKIRLAPLASGLSVAASVSAAGREAPRSRHRSGVGGDQEPAGRHQHEHRVHDVELRRAQHLERGEMPAADLRCTGGAGFGRGRRLGRRMPQELRDGDDDETLKEAGRDERRLISARCDHRRDERNEQRRAAAESRRHDARRQPAAVLEPLQRRSDRSAVHERGADARRAVQGVEHRQRGGVSQSRPAQPAQQPRGADEPARAEAIDEPSIERLDPRLKQDEQRERELNVREPPARARLERLDEERPGVLQVRDHDHRDQRGAELKPAVVDVHRTTSSMRGADRAGPRCSSSSFAHA